MLALIAAAVAAAALVALIVQATSSEAPLVAEAEAALWWLAAGVLAAALALGAWALQRRHEDHLRAEEKRLRAETGRLQAQLDERERELTALRADADGLRGEVDRRGNEIDEREADVARLRKEIETLRSDVAEREAKLETAKDRAARFSRRDSHEREVNRRLRHEIAELQARRGSLGDWTDIRTLVLRMAMTLVEADKGLLLMRDADGDGEVDETLQLVEHEGFDADASRSALAQRFGHEVLERDRIVREDEPERRPEGDRTPADEEIRNLVAIPIYIRDRFSGVVVCANREGGFEELDDEVLLALGDQAGAALNNQRLHGELRRSYVSTIRVLAEAIQAKDPFLRGHSDEVSEYVGAVAERMSIDGERREQLIVGSLLHDIGKIGISERILHKPAKLTQEEFAIIQLHPRIGYRLIEQVPSLAPIAAAILHHHERYDGGGYPAGLKGEQIPLEARIVCVADAFSAMTADRPYRRRMALGDACEELKRHAGTQFDPEVVRVFIEEVGKCPLPDDDGALASALGDSELQLHRDGDEPVLGAGALALTDSLTLLYGHRYLHEQAGAEAERARLQDRPFAVVMACVDEVEIVNQRDGYGAGDQHLRAAARALSQLAVRIGATACRDGGLTLALLMPGGRVPEADLDALVREAMRGLGAVRVGVAISEPQEAGEAVIARARTALGAEDVATR